MQQHAGCALSQASRARAISGPRPHASGYATHRRPLNFPRAPDLPPGRTPGNEPHPAEPPAGAKERDRRCCDVDVLARGKFRSPDEATGYVHGTGRTGRAGREGTAITLVLPEQQSETSQVALRNSLCPARA